MATARPAAGPPAAFFELRAHPFDMLPSGLIFLDGDGPADPLVARERRNILPRCQRLRVGNKCFFQIRRQFMHHAAGNLCFGHTIDLG